VSVVVHPRRLVEADPVGVMLVGGPQSAHLQVVLVEGAAFSLLVVSFRHYRYYGNICKRVFVKNFKKMLSVNYLNYTIFYRKIHKSFLKVNFVQQTIAALNLELLVNSTFQKKKTFRKGLPA